MPAASHAGEPATAEWLVMTSGPVPLHYPRWGGPEVGASSESLTQHGLAAVAQSRMVLAGVLDVASGDWPTHLGVIPEPSTVRGETVTAAYAELGDDAFLFLEFGADRRTEVWTYVPPLRLDSLTPSVDPVGRLQLRRLLHARGLSDGMVVFPPMSE